MHDTTYYGLQCWSKRMFETLGWIALAHADGDKKHVQNYVENIEYLIKHIDLKINKYKKMSRSQSHCLGEKIDDLEILKENLLTLHKYAKKMCKK